jgi:hypothetical protein
MKIIFKKFNPRGKQLDGKQKYENSILNLRGKHFDGKQKYDEEEIIFNKS